MMNERKESPCPSTHNYIQAYTKECLTLIQAHELAK